MIQTDVSKVVKQAWLSFIFIKNDCFNVNLRGFCFCRVHFILSRNHEHCLKHHHFIKGYISQSEALYLSPVIDFSLQCHMIQSGHPDLTLWSILTSLTYIRNVSVILIIASISFGVITHQCQWMTRLTPDKFTGLPGKVLKPGPLPFEVTNLAPSILMMYAVHNLQSRAQNESVVWMNYYLMFMQYFFQHA